MLVGEHHDKLRRLGLDRLSTFGVLAGRSHAEAMTILRVLLANGWIDLSDGDFPVPLVTPPGWRVMRGDVPARVRLPIGARRAKATARVKATTTAAATAAATATATATVMATATATATATAPATATASKAREAPKKGSPPDELEERDLPLYDALRAYRTGLAKEKGVPAYVIAHDRTLREIARIRPISMEDLELARGLGRAKIAQIGEGILRIVRQFAGR
jgi:ATP-dependent DNA helicase RecQ